MSNFNVCLVRLCFIQKIIVLFAALDAGQFRALLSSLQCKYSPGSVYDWLRTFTRLTASAWYRTTCAGRHHKSQTILRFTAVRHDGDGNDHSRRNSLKLANLRWNHRH